MRVTVNDKPNRVIIEQSRNRSKADTIRALLRLNPNLDTSDLVNECGKMGIDVSYNHAHTIRAEFKADPNPVPKLEAKLDAQYLVKVLEAVKGLGGISKVSKAVDYLKPLVI